MLKVHSPSHLSWTMSMHITRAQAPTSTWPHLLLFLFLSPFVFFFAPHNSSFDWQPLQSNDVAPLQHSVARFVAVGLHLVGEEGDFEDENWSMLRNSQCVWHGLLGLHETRQRWLNSDFLIFHRSFRKPLWPQRYHDFAQPVDHLGERFSDSSLVWRLLYFAFRRQLRCIPCRRWLSK